MIRFSLPSTGCFTLENDTYFLHRPPPPTAKTAHATHFKFVKHAPLGNTFWVTKAIFDFPFLCWDIGNCRFHPWGAFPPSSCHGWNSKNRLDDPKTIFTGTIHTKFHVRTICEVGCRGGGGQKEGIIF